MSEQKTPRSDGLINPCPCGKPGCSITSFDEALALCRAIEQELAQAKEEVEQSRSARLKLGSRIDELRNENAELRAKLSQPQTPPPTTAT